MVLTHELNLALISVSDALAKALQRHVSEDSAHSDHQAIPFEMQQYTKVNFSRKTVERRTVNGFDRGTFKEVLLM